METVSYAGWSCARFESELGEALVTLDVGPRVIRLAPHGGCNLFHEVPEEAGVVGGEGFRAYGGHRLWTAPEDLARTYAPDNEAVQVDEDGWMSAAPDASGLRRSMRVSGVEGGWIVEHRVANESGSSIEVAPWALTVMAPGGTCVFPQEPFVPHGESLLPVRPLVLWAYTAMDDPRWTWGRRVVRLRQDPARGPQKVGARVSAGVAAYSLGEWTFVKRFPCIEGAAYPDGGCNFEVFTREDMLEVESLGPMATLALGASTTHTERWALARTSAPTEDEACAAWLAELARQGV
ncbi:MAG: hypothetical protein M9921_08585 [Fimbriimonadaceae bacterium]|nr:hypothetical protein [Fimbriimonadaceae bacterium]